MVPENHELSFDANLSLPSDISAAASLASWLGRDDLTAAQTYWESESDSSILFWEDDLEGFAISPLSRIVPPVPSIVRNLVEPPDSLRMRPGSNSIQPAKVLFKPSPIVTSLTEPAV